MLKVIVLNKIVFALPVYYGYLTEVQKTLVENLPRQETLSATELKHIVISQLVMSQTHPVDQVFYHCNIFNTVYIKHWHMRIKPEFHMQSINPSNLLLFGII